MMSLSQTGLNLIEEMDVRTASIGLELLGLKYQPNTLARMYGLPTEILAKSFEWIRDTSGRVDG
jgi:hypothetical protein